MVNELPEKFETNHFIFQTFHIFYIFFHDLVADSYCFCMFLHVLLSV